MFVLLPLFIFLIWKNINNKEELTNYNNDEKKIGNIENIENINNVESKLTSLSPKLSEAEIKNNPNLQKAKNILDFLWNNNKKPGGIYDLWSECDGKTCQPSERSGNHAVVIWARSKYVEATGDQQELERLMTDIDAFARIFEGKPADTTYQSSAFGCSLFIDVKENSSYLPHEYKEKLLNLCQRSVLSADIYSYYGRLHGYVKPVTEKELDALIEQLLVLPDSNIEANERLAHYEAQKIQFQRLLPIVDNSYLDGFGCNSLTPMVGGKCDALPSKNDQAYIYDERYAYLLANQLAKTKYNYKHIFKDQTIKNQPFELQEKALLVDALLYYYTQPNTGRFFLGKSCLLRQEILALAETIENKKFSQAIKEFARKENYFLSFNDNVVDYWHLASLFECALAESFISPSNFSESLNLALSTWSEASEFNYQGVLAQPVPNSNKFNVYTINNAMLAGVLAKER